MFEAGAPWYYSAYDMSCIAACRGSVFALLLYLFLRILWIHYIFDV